MSPPFQRLASLFSSQASFSNIYAVAESPCSSSITLLLCHRVTILSLCHILCRLYHVFGS